MSEMDVWLFAGGVGVFICILGGYMFTSRRRRKRIVKQVNRIRAANEPGYKWPGDNMYTTIKDGVVTYRKRRGEEK